MRRMLARLFWTRRATLSEATARDAAAIAALHGASFRRGWSDVEIEQLLTERNTITHRATVRAFAARLHPVAAGRRRSRKSFRSRWRRSQRGRGLARALLNLHLRRLAGLGVQAVFLEVDEDNEPARRLYRRAGFQ